jgi:hypothetical protein
MARSGEPAAHQRRRSDNLCERDWNSEDLFPRISDVNDRFPKREITSLQKHPKKACVFSKVRRIESYLKKNVKLKEKKMDGIICTIGFVTHEAHGVTNL